MYRFFENQHLSVGENFNITGENASHIIKSLRFSIGEEFEVVSGDDVFVAKVEKIDKKNNILEANVVSSIEDSSEPKLYIRLLQGLTKGTKLDFIIQKCTEIGVSEIIPLELKRSISKINNEKVENKVARWNKIAFEAAMQSKRTFIPKIHSPINLSQLVDNEYLKDFSIVAYENERSLSISKYLKSITKPEVLNIIIGPEGGFEEEEVKILIENGVNSITLGKRILRTETAGLIAATIALYEFGEME